MWATYSTGGNRNQGHKTDEMAHATAPGRSAEPCAAMDVCDSPENASPDRIKSASKLAARSSSTMELLIGSNEKITKAYNFPGGVYGKRNELNSSNDDQADGEFHQKAQRHRAAKKANKILTDQERKERRRKKLMKHSNISL